MTDSDIQKLRAIRAKCEELLEIAAKRTPGAWQWVGHSWSDDSVYCGDRRIVGASIRDEATESNQHKLESEMDGNTQFIAACAGAAEAGWRTTIAAIDALPTIVQQSGRIKRIHWGYDGDCGADGLACDCEDFANDAIKAILTAWEGIV